MQEIKQGAMVEGTHRTTFRCAARGYLSEKVTFLSKCGKEQASHSKRGIFKIK